MKRNSLYLAALLTLLLSAAPLTTQAQPPVAAIDGAPERVIAEQPTTGDSDAEAHPVRDSGIGCATGAVLGSVLPGLGNVVGCAVGGLLGWWFS